MGTSNGLVTLYPGAQEVDVAGAKYTITPLEIGDYVDFERSIKAEKLSRIERLYCVEADAARKLELQCEYLAYDLPSTAVDSAARTIAGTTFFVQRSLDRGKPGQMIPFLAKLNQLYILIMALMGVGPDAGKAEAAS